MSLALRLLLSPLSPLSLPLSLPRSPSFSLSLPLSSLSPSLSRFHGHRSMDMWQLTSSYPHLVVVHTRWADQDVYGHVNNKEYYSYVDTVVNEYLIREGGLDITSHRGPRGYVVRSECDYKRPIHFQMEVAVGIRVERLGTSSVTYRFALFAKSKDSVEKNDFYLTHTIPTEVGLGKGSEKKDLIGGKEREEDGKEREEGEKWVGEFCASGRFVHVFVSLPEEKPTKIEGKLREALSRLV